MNNIKSLNLPFADDKEWLKALKKERYPIRKYQQHVPEQVIKVAKKAIKADRNSRYHNCLQFRQALQKIPMAIEWSPVNRDKWIGAYGTESFELSLYLKKSGYFIDFKRNGRKVSDKCREKIAIESVARESFFEIIRQSTIKM